MPPKTSQKKGKKVAKSKRRQPKQGVRVMTRAGAADFADFARSGDLSRQFDAVALFERAAHFIREENYEEAMRYTRASAEMGHAMAQHSLGLLYSTGSGAPLDFAEAARWLRLASDQGVAQAQCDLGKMFRDGSGVLQDTEEAARLFLLASEAGIAEAQFDLGCLYRDGEGVGHDLTKAVRMFQLAAAQDYGQALVTMGSCFLFGVGVPPDFDEGLRFLERASAQGIAEALLILGAMYEAGGRLDFLGAMYAGSGRVEKNVALAKQYYRRAEKGSTIHYFGSRNDTENVLKKLLDDIKHTCAACETVGDNHKVCSRCKGPRYCSVVCQKKNWAEHKHVCRKLSKAEDDSDRMARDANDAE